jgi:hypothetical protein
VIQDDTSEARNSAACATSNGAPMRRRGSDSAALAWISGWMNLSIFFLRTIEGATALTRTPTGPSLLGEAIPWRYRVDLHRNR